MPRPCGAPRAVAEVPRRPERFLALETYYEILPGCTFSLGGLGEHTTQLATRGGGKVAYNDRARSPPPLGTKEGSWGTVRGATY